MPMSSVSFSPNTLSSLTSLVLAQNRTKENKPPKTIPTLFQVNESFDTIETWTEIENQLMEFGLNPTEDQKNLANTINKLPQGSDEQKFAFAISYFIFNNPSKTEFTDLMWRQLGMPITSQWYTTLKKIIDGVKNPDIKEAKNGNLRDVISLIKKGRTNSDAFFNRAINFVRLARIQIQIRNYFMFHVNEPHRFAFIRIPANTNLEICHVNYQIPRDERNLVLEVNQRLADLGSKLAFDFQSRPNQDGTYKCILFLLQNCVRGSHESQPLFWKHPLTNPKRNLLFVTGEGLTGKVYDNYVTFVGVTRDVKDKGISLILSDKIKRECMSYFSMYPNFGRRTQKPYIDRFANLSTRAHNESVQQYISDAKEFKNSPSNEEILKDYVQNKNLFVQRHETAHQISTHHYPLVKALLQTTSINLSTNVFPMMKQVEELAAELKAMEQTINGSDKPFMLTLLVDGIEMFWEKAPPQNWLVNDAFAFNTAILIKAAKVQDGKIIFDMRELAVLSISLQEQVKAYMEETELFLLKMIASFLKGQGRIDSNVSVAQAIELTLSYMDNLASAYLKNVPQVSKSEALFSVYQDLFTQIANAGGPEWQRMQNELVTKIPKIQLDLAKVIGFQGTTADQFNTFLLDGDF